MNKFNSLQHLDGNHQNGFQSELTSTIFKEVFERWTKKIDNKNIVVTTSPKIIYFRKANSSIVNFIKFCFIVELRKLCFRRFEFDSDFFVSLNINGFENFSKCSTSNFLLKFPFVVYNHIAFRRHVLYFIKLFIKY